MKEGITRLYYFTDSYPFSVDYTWKSAEITEAAKQFDEVIIVPFTYKKDKEFSFAENVRIVKPTLGNTLFAKTKYIKHLFSRQQPQPWLREFFKALPKGKQAVINWYLATIYSDIVVKTEIFKQLKQEVDQQEHTVLFFQWTMNNALLVPFLNTLGYQNIICRMHGFDLYEFRHDHYLPYKSAILKHAKVCTFISEHGLNYATQLYPFIARKSKIHYLGAKSMAENIVVAHQKFHLVSVSRVVPLKRLDLLVEALKLVKTPMKWTHLGDGYAYDNIKKRANDLKQLNSHIDVEFLGWLSPEAITHYFSKNGIHALILVSETEGLPVVIMEAFSASIPVIATNVGGISELVDKHNGILLNAHPNASEVAEAIEQMANEAFGTYTKRREAALKSYLKSFNLETNTKKFIDFLSAQCH